MKEQGFRRQHFFVSRELLRNIQRQYGVDLSEQVSIAKENESNFRGKNN